MAKILKTKLNSTFFIGLVCICSIFLTQCTPKKDTKNQQVLLKAEKKIFLEKVNLSANSSLLLYQLDSAQITLADVVLFCQQTNNEAHKIGLIQLLCGKMSNNLQEQNYAYWAGILYDLQRFYENIAILKTPQQHIFFDVGSGNGEKLFAALCAGFEQAVGIEYSGELVPIAEQNLASLLQTKQAKVIQADALTLADSVYEQADFIYLYSPIKDNWVMAKLVKKILQSMKNEATLLEVRFVYREELCQLMAWELPIMAGLFAIKKEDNAFFYAEYDHHQTHWKPIIKKEK